MIIADLETTGLMGSSGLAIDQQPRIIEYAFMKVDFDTLAETGRMTGFLDPKIPISPEVTKITGITPAMISGAPHFTRIVNALTAFFIGEEIVVAHNANFDLSVLEVELRRVDRVTRFPWPPERLCTVENTSHLALPDRKLTTLFERLFEYKPAQTHRAMDDVLLLHQVVKRLRADGVL